MKAKHIWAIICSLAMSNGTWGRIKSYIIESGRQQEILAELEDINFQTDLDVVLFFEEGIA